jgi:D-lactate dehydrogenase
MSRPNNPTISPLSQALLDLLREILDKDGLLTDPADCWPYGSDNSRRHHPPQAVVRPNSARQVVEIVAACNRWKTPLVARGFGTGTAGAAVPIAGGVVLSCERLDRIIEIDPANRLAVVEPGVTNEALQQALKPHGFFWPPDPTSAAVCSVGGNLACNSAGPRAVKYGTTRDNVLGLSAVTGTGELIHTGVRTTKGVVGLDLTRLLIGSEGTLAVITEATLKLTPLPQAKRAIRAVYASVEAAAAAVAKIMAQPVTPCALEFMDDRCLALIKGHASVDLPEGAAAMLMIEVDGQADQVASAQTAVMAAAEVEGAIEVRGAANQAEADQLWAARKALSPAQRKVAPKKINEDVVVPVSRLPELIGGLRQLAARHAIIIVNFGHAGNGNIHVNLLIDPDDPIQLKSAHACLDEVFTLVLSLGGTLSGEHGIGLEKRDFVAREIDPATLHVMQQIKQLFDPNAILNPGKSLPTPPKP